MDLLKTFNTALDSIGVEEGSSILLAISGGCDSMVMLDLFARVKKIEKFRLGIAHFNHRLRGSEAEQDLRFICSQARKYGICFFGGRSKVSEYQKKMGLSGEEAAREVRYQFLYSVQRKGGYRYLAMGHHADDQAETILMNLLRGGGLRGLGGIKPRVGSRIRPLLTITRSEIQQYARNHAIHWVEDSSNQSGKYMRNRVRHSFLKNAEAVSGRSVIEPICRSGQILSELESDLNIMAHEALKHCTLSRDRMEIVLDINKILTYFVSIQKQLFIHILRHYFQCRYVDFHELENIVALLSGKQSGSRLYLKSKIMVTRSQGRLTFQQVQQNTDGSPVMIKPGIAYDLPGLVFSSRAVGKLRINRLGREEYVDMETLKGPLTIRNVREGDCFIPLGMQGRKNALKFLMDLKVPLPERGRVKLLLSGDLVVWVIGYRLDDRFKVENRTKRILRMVAEYDH